MGTINQAICYSPVLAMAHWEHSRPDGMVGGGRHDGSSRNPSNQWVWHFTTHPPARVYARSIIMDS